MSQTSANAAAVPNTTVTSSAAPAIEYPTFNLVIVPDSKVLEKVQKRFDFDSLFTLSLWEEYLPAAGARRGAVLAEMIKQSETTAKNIQTIVIFVDKVWVQALGNPHMPAHGKSIWRSIENKLFGHHTQRHRNMIVVADAAESEMTVVKNGQALPTWWKEEAPRKATPVKNDKSKTPANSKGSKGQSNDAAGATKSTKPSRAGRSANSRTQDLFLLAKGHYGPTGGGHGMAGLKAVITHHTMVNNPTHEELAIIMMEAITKGTPRSYWGEYAFLQEVVRAGSKGSDELIGALFGRLALAPAQIGENFTLKLAPVDGVMKKIVEEALSQ